MTPTLTIYDSLSRIIYNIFVPKPVVLDNMVQIGLKRLHTFLKQNILCSEQKTKRTWQKICTFTKSVKTQNQAKSQIKKRDHHTKELFSTFTSSWNSCCTLSFSYSQFRWHYACIRVCSGIHGPNYLGVQVRTSSSSASYHFNWLVILCTYAPNSYVIHLWDVFVQTFKTKPSRNLHSNWLT